MQAHSSEPYLYCSLRNQVQHAADVNGYGYQSVHVSVSTHLQNLSILKIPPKMMDTCFRWFCRQLLPSLIGDNIWKESNFELEAKVSQFNDFLFS